MNTTVTPPPPPPTPAPVPPATGGSPGRPVAIVLIVVGALVLMGAVIGGVRGAVAAANLVTDRQTVDARGIASLDVDAAASSFRIEYGGVSEATLEVTDARGEWRLDRDGDELRVSTRDGLFGGWRWGWSWGGDEGEVVLTLPQALRDRAIDAQLALAAGELHADGTFGELGLDLGAGSLRVAGSAESLVVDVSAGSARLDLADVRDADLSVAAGRLTGELTGSAPDSLGVSVSAGSLDLVLPAGTYDVRQDVSAGGFDNRLETSRSSAHAVTVDVAAGQATLRSER